MEICPVSQNGSAQEPFYVCARQPSKFVLELTPRDLLHC